MVFLVSLCSTMILRRAKSAWVHCSWMSVFAVVTEVEKNAIWISAHVFVEILAYSLIVTNVHLAAVAVKSLSTGMIFAFKYRQGTEEEIGQSDAE